MIDGQILGFLLVVGLQILGCTWAQSVPTSPCPDVFQYNVDSAGMWYALITVPNPQPNLDIKLTVEMSIDAILPSRYAGKIELAENKNEVWRRIMTKDQRPVQYELYFPLSWPLPVVRRISSNQDVVCMGNPPKMMTKISLEHTLYPIRLNAPLSQNHNIDQNQNQNNPDPSNVGVEQTTKQVPTHVIGAIKPNISIGVPIKEPPKLPIHFTPPPTKEPPKFPIIFTPPPVTLQPPTTTTTKPPNPADNECGISFKSTVPLVINGKATERGEWPWLVAMYTKSTTPRLTGLQFQCGGSLLSPTVVLTAAHCIKYKGRPEVKAEAIVLYLGKYNLQEWTERHNQARDVEKVHLHPDYNEEGFEADLAVLIMRYEVEYTVYVQPICLWKFEGNINKIVGQSGTVAGWGRDETGAVSLEPRKVVMPIVSQEQCLLSNKEFVFYTSNRTFCAGSQDGSGPCSGDSGGGFMIGYPDGDRMKWYLRGVVHLSLWDKLNQQCDLHNYLIYTDVAKFMAWIRGFVPY
ncbi:serine protease gd-like isoform X1 [Periplaneta americana]|uniref:serine protease gd-like isoform X1 n=2 Tax=Periplaneta americana TaxID=6978 RepID=UPI0037E87E26